MISLAVCEKLRRLAEGEELPASSFVHQVIDQLLSEGIVQQRISGRTKKVLYLSEVDALHNWLYNAHGINDLADYILVLKDADTHRADLIKAGNDSKAQRKRSYQGFLVNSYSPVLCRFKGLQRAIHPVPGMFEFIYDYQNFRPDPDVTIVGVENMENFRHIDRQAYLFSSITPLFVCRYPQEQSKDVLKWLLSVTNPYLHYGDFDFAGIQIYQREFKLYLNERASFFMPPGIETLLTRYGNASLYDKQAFMQIDLTEEPISDLVGLLHRTKKGLEQEALLIQQ